MDPLKITDQTGAARTAVAWYDTHAEQLADDYEGLDAIQAHPQLFELVRGVPPLRALDVGAGTGRDAAALSALGHAVTAVDPSRKMLRLARALHADRGIVWKCDALPDLASLQGSYDLILLSGVWMHVLPEARRASFARLLDLTASSGQIYITLRNGPKDPDRAMWPTTAAEIRALADALGMTMTDLGRRPDLLGRDDVHWRTLLVRKP
jgi:2-polyprenyl-3-methyl-5-hydroxy-6-metoxy-1,4-benzoquinol methylase